MKKPDKNDYWVKNRIHLEFNSHTLHNVIKHMWLHRIIVLLLSVSSNYFYGKQTCKPCWNTVSYPIVQSQLTKKRFFPYFWKSNQTSEITIFLDQIEKLSVLVSFWWLQFPALLTNQRLRKLVKNNLGNLTEYDSQVDKP